MSKNTLVVAAAGSGKTELIVSQCLAIDHDPVLITTYTESNRDELERRFVSKNGHVPSNICIQTWFSFLLQHGVRPYQCSIDQSLDDEKIGFVLTTNKSGMRTNQAGQPILVRGRPIYWGEKDVKRYYFTSNFRLFSDKISKFVFESHKATSGMLLDRVASLFKHIFIDEVQDLAGYDLELIKLFFRSQASITLVGDPRQVTYLTHHTTKHKKYRNGRIEAYIRENLGKRISCKIDATSLGSSHRNNKSICSLAAKLYPNLPAPEPCRCETCRSYIVEHEGIFLLPPSNRDDYLSRYEPMQLRWDRRTKCNTQHPVATFGSCKGLTFERVLIYPTKDMVAWLNDRSQVLSDKTRAKLYVAITRAKFSVAFVVKIDAEGLGRDELARQLSD